MKKIDRLKKEAMGSCRWRQHNMGKFVNLTYGEGWRDPGPRYTASSECSLCGAWVQIDTRPAPDGIEIGGPAVAVTCLGADHPTTPF